MRLCDAIPEMGREGSGGNRWPGFAAESNCPFALHAAVPPYHTVQIALVWTSLQAVETTAIGTGLFDTRVTNRSPIGCGENWGASAPSPKENTRLSRMEVYARFVKRERREALEI